VQQGYYNDYLAKRFEQRDDKIFHLVLQLTTWNPQDQARKRTTLFVVDLAVPVQSTDPQFGPLNAFLSQSLGSVAHFLKEFYAAKPVAGFAFDGNHLSRLLKKCLQAPELSLHPLFFVSSQEDFKDESKQLLSLTHQ